MSIPRYFTVFVANENLIVFFIYFPDISFLVYRNATDFYTLIWYQLLHLFIVSKSLLVDSLGFSVYRTVSSAKGEFSFFLFNLNGFYFCLLIPLARTFSTILDSSCVSGHPCFVPVLTEEAFKFSALSMVFAENFLYMTFFMLRYFFFYITLLEYFNH